jgi:hypothetical protein
MSQLSLADLTKFLLIQPPFRNSSEIAGGETKLNICYCIPADLKTILEILPNVGRPQWKTTLMKEDLNSWN